jgi:hypothetical protein
MNDNHIKIGSNIGHNFKPEEAAQPVTQDDGSVGQNAKDMGGKFMEFVDSYNKVLLEHTTRCLA